MAAGVMSINHHHGGAIADAAIFMKRVIDRADSQQITIDSAAQGILDEEKSAGRRVPGFGHRYHTNDPRTARLFALAKEAGVDGPYFDAARAIERRFAVGGKRVPMNVDGALGAILSQLGFPADNSMMNGLFMIARMPGLVAHAIEEKSRMIPMRRIDPVAHSYDGPAARGLS